MDRLDDQKSLDEALIAELIEQGTELVIQYSKPMYTRELLAQLDRICERHGDKVEIRFYSHFKKAFDCRILDRMPHVQRLSVDYLDAFTGLEALFALPALRHLTIGTTEDVPADFLAHANLASLRSLTLAPAKKSSIDLAPIAALTELTYLNLVEHHRGIEALATLPRLRWLTLSRQKKTVRLDFLSRMSALRTLRLILGGRDDLHEVAHPKLEHFEVTWVRGLSDFRAAEFPRLKFLQIQDQICLPALQFSEANAALTEVRLLNCKTLANVAGLGKLPALKEVRIYGTAIGLEPLIAAGLPPTLKIFAFYTGKEKLDKPIRQKLDSLGYAESSPVEKIRFWQC